jgi:hypothetical protein
MAPRALQPVPLESSIQAAICDYLSLRRHFFWRQNTVGLFDASTGRHRSMPKYSMSGVPDIILIRDGQFIGLEVKRPGGKQSEAQEEFERKVRFYGGQYHIVHSIEEVQALGL